MAFDSREHLMSMPQNEIPEPERFTLQAGKYYGKTYRYEQGPTPWDSESDALFYYVQLTEPGPDIDPERMNGVKLDEINLRPIAYPITPSRMAAIKRLHASMGLNPSLSTDANIPESIGKRVLCTVNAKPSNREGDDTVYNNIVFMVGVPETVSGKSSKS